MTVEIPLLHDNHNHVSLYAAFLSCPDISTLAPAAALVLLERLPPDRLTVVRGWKSYELPLSRALLGRLPPVLLVNFSLHGFAVSDSGIPFVESAVPDIARRRDDLAWCEANVPAIFAAYCDLAGLDESRLLRYIDGMLPLGIGSSDEMTVPTAQALDCCASSACAARIAPWVSPDLYKKLDIPRRALLSGIKLYLDGAIGARSAALRGPWIGQGSPMFTYQDADLENLVSEIGRWNTGISMHAIGELAIAQALDALEAALAGGGSFSLIRLEHVQFIDRTLAGRAKELGAVLSMQPNFNSDSKDYADRLPEPVLAANNPFRMLIDQCGFIPGKDLIFGSDGMPDGIACAAGQSLFPVYASQRLTLDELVAGYGEARGISGSVVLEVDEAARRVSLVSVELTDPVPRTLLP